MLFWLVVYSLSWFWIPFHPFWMDVCVFWKLALGSETQLIESPLSASFYVLSRVWGWNPFSHAIVTLNLSFEDGSGIREWVYLISHHLSKFYNYIPNSSLLLIRDNEFVHTTSLSDLRVHLYGLSSLNFLIFFSELEACISMISYLIHWLWPSIMDLGSEGH